MAAAKVQSQLQIETFIPGTMRWDRWLLRLEGAYKMLDIKNEAKVQYLLHYIGHKSFDTLYDTLGGIDPYTKTYEQLTATLKNLYAPASLEIAECYKFHGRKQLAGENVQTFVTALRNLSQHCNFGTYLDSALRNQLVLGLKSNRIRSRLLETKELTLQKAVDTAIAMELTEKEANIMTEQPSSLEYLQVGKNQLRKDTAYKKKPGFRKNYNQSERNSATKAQKPPSNKGKELKCYRCGRDHYASSCTLSRQTRCLSCNGAGHLASVCFKRGRNNANELEVADQWDESGEGQYDEGLGEVREILKLEQTSERDKFTNTFLINMIPVEFEIDSGAAVTVMSKNQAKELFKGESVYKSNLQLITYCKKLIKVIGYIAVSVRFAEKEFKLNIYLTEIVRAPLLGREWLRQIMKACGADALFSPMLLLHKGSDNRIELNTILEKYKEITNPNFEKIKGIKATLTLKPEVKPVFVKARPVPFSILPLVDKELDLLISEGILVKVDNSEYATPIVPVLKNKDKIRICGDFSVTINPQLVIDEYPLPTPEQLFRKMAGGKIFSKIDLRQAYLQMEVDEACQKLLVLSTHRGLLKCTRLPCDSSLTSQ